MPIRHGGIAHHRPQLFANRLPFSFKGVLHEYLEAPPGGFTRENANGFPSGPARAARAARTPANTRTTRPSLEQALETETDPFLISRYTFYLAQSYRDCGEKEKALANYLKRAELGYWDRGDLRKSV